MKTLTLINGNKRNILLGESTIKFQPVFSRIRQYLLALVVISIAVLLCFQLAQSLGYYIVAFILLILVSILATFLKTGPTLLASLLSLLIWNFFFIPPHHTFHIEKTEDILMFGMFGLVVIMNGVFTTRVRRQEKLTREREMHTNALFQLTRELSKTSGIDEVMTVSTEEIKKHFGLDSFIISQGEPGELLPFEQVATKFKLSREEFNVANWAFKNNRKAGKYTDDFSFADYSYYPLTGTLINTGVVVLKQEGMFATDKEVFWDTFLAQISNALEREFLAELARKARFLDESDRFYKTLFNSVSHELRIPVATILAASDALLGNTNPGGMQTALSKEIYTATLRLNRLIENLLNMSRLESGRIAPRLDWYDMNDLVYKIINDLKEELKAFSLKVNVPENIPLVRIDFGLMEQVLYNLIYNSCQYAPATSEITLEADYTDGNLVIRVLDRGPGFPPEALENVFNKFFRVNEKGTGGLGLGLSIVKGFAEAHKGHVIAENRPGGGAVVTVSIPSDVPDITDIPIEKSDG
jgi:two-component system sensor histidine kinase KdpD